MNSESEECLRKIAELKPDDIGSSEENVKQTVFVPILKCLGHHESQLDFEYPTRGLKVDIFIKGLPEERKVIIDTKNYNEDLNRHLDQLGQYAFLEGAMLAIIANGEEIRIYSPFMQGFPFEKRCLYVIKRKKLVDSIDVLERFLSRESLVKVDVPKYIKEREEELKNAYKEVKGLQSHYKGEIKRIEEQIEGLNAKIKDLQSEQKEKIENIWKSLGLEELYQPREGGSGGGGVTPPPGRYVKPRDFEYRGDGIFALRDNPSVTLSVKKNSPIAEVKKSIESRGFRNDNYGSFVYTLKVTAGYLPRTK